MLILWLIWLIWMSYDGCGSVVMWLCGHGVLWLCGLARPWSSLALAQKHIADHASVFGRGCRSVFPVSQLEIAMHMCGVPCENSELHLVTIMRLSCKMCGTCIDSLIWKHTGLPNMMHCSSGDPLACVRHVLSRFRMTTHLVRCLIRILDFLAHRPCPSVSFDLETCGFVEFH